MLALNVDFYTVYWQTGRSGLELDHTPTAERTLTVGIVTVPPDCDVAALQRSLADALGPTGLATSLRHENIFRATNEVGPIRNLLDPSVPDVGRNARS